MRIVGPATGLFAALRLARAVAGDGARFVGVDFVGVERLLGGITHPSPSGRYWPAALTVAASAAATPALRNAFPERGRVILGRLYAELTLHWATWLFASSQRHRVTQLEGPGWLDLANCRDLAPVKPMLAKSVP